MKDSLKKYIRDHREEFDTLEVPEDTFDKIMLRLNEIAVSEEKIVPLFSWKKWSAAASVAIIFSIGLYAFWNQKEGEKTRIAVHEKLKENGSTVDVLNQKNDLETVKIETVIQQNTGKAFTKNNSDPSQKIVETKSLAQNDNLEGESNFDELKALELINDQHSASSRLRGIDLLKSFSASDEKIINILSEKALSDENTNVRLAAVEALSVHIENTEVSKNIRQIFLNQDDPIVQKELIAILTEKNPSQLNREVNAKLKELTLDPTTAVFVKDEAYAVLMRY
ncbi:HEAT repeat domain-containing protein [Chryseobacterium sp. LC2016-29]|uniref:HEAT repeat domain-containing protein n=1 Tax=Chryseobacterium sp. LC2016-29 TaxID=2897331 RepID=UPI001E339C52|nr:HEAT repeat domain-containing protein [Chryseobacterium sp. LC2016-29]MCD0480519.1 HEAT repeat domain-containing protein [Chryseobacterium sp. LC2016-29]